MVVCTFAADQSSELVVVIQVARISGSAARTAIEAARTDRNATPRQSRW
jgi:hypothetical protein